MAAEELILRLVVEGGKVAAAEIDGVAGATTRLDVASGKAAKSIGLLSRAGGVMGISGKAAGFLGVALSVTAAVKSFTEYQRQMEMLRTQTGASQGEVNRMSGAVLGLATKVGMGPNGLALGLYHLESVGIRGKKALELLRVAAEGAQIGNASLEDTVYSLNGVIKSGIGGVKNYAQTMGILNGIVGAGDMRMTDLNKAIGTGIMSVASAFGLQIKDVGAGLATFGDLNLRGAHAATLLRQAIVLLGAHSTSAAKQLGSIGIPVNQLADDMHKPQGLLMALRDLREHLVKVGDVYTSGKFKGQIDPAGTEVLTKVFGGSRSVTGALMLLDHQQMLEQGYTRISKGARNFNKDWQAFTHTLAFYFGVIKAFAEVTLIRFGMALSHIVGAINSVIKAFAEGKTWAVLLVGVLGGLAAAWAAVQVATLAEVAALYVYAAAVNIQTIISLTGEIYANAGAWGVLNAVMDMNPFVFIAAAIVALIAIFVLMYVKVKWFRDAVNDAWKWIKDAAVNVIDWIGKNWPKILLILSGPIGWAVYFIVKHLGAIKGAFKSAFNFIKNDVVMPIVNWIIKKWHQMIRIITAPVKFISGLFHDVFGGGSKKETRRAPPRGRAIGHSGNTSSSGPSAATTLGLGLPRAYSQPIGSQFSSPSAGSRAGVLHAAIQVNIDGRPTGQAIARVALQEQALR